jgi:hypothetical protein
VALTSCFAGPRSGLAGRPRTYTAADREASVTDPVGDKTALTDDNRGNVALTSEGSGSAPVALQEPNADLGCHVCGPGFTYAFAGGDQH